MKGAFSLISIIIPVFNVEKYLHRCVESVLSQTFADLEVILVDDGSTDQSGHICDEYSRHDKRVKVFHQVNAGPSSARNLGLSVASGDYIAFVDSDDYLDTSMYQKLYNVLTKTNADIAVCNFFHVSTTKERMIVDHGFGSCSIENEDIVKHVISKCYNGKGAWDFSPCDKLYNSDIIRKNKMEFDESRIKAEDRFFNLMAFYHARKIAYTNEVLYYYVRNENSITHYFSRNQLAEWKREIEDELELNRQYFHLTIDFDSYYRNTIIYAVNYLVHVFTLKREDKHEIVSEFIKSDFYRNVIRHDMVAPMYAKILCRLIKYNRPMLAKTIIRIYAVLKKIRYMKQTVLCGGHDV